MAHLPGWTRDSRVELVAVCDADDAVVEEAARQFGVGEHTTDHRRLLERDDIDVIDIVTGDSGHFDLTMEALEAGKHVLVEKPVAHDFRDTLRPRSAASKRLKTKVGFAFRYDGDQWRAGRAG
jgi:predicted dehydrogenase